MTKSMRVLGAVSAIVLMAAATAGPARAASMTAKDILSSFNLVTTGNVSTQSDIVGDAIVGGDLSGATFFGGGANIPSSPTLYLFGKLNSSLNLNSGGSLYYAGSTSPHVNFNGGGKRYDTLPNPLGYYTDPLTDLSTQLSQLTATTGTSFVKGNFNAGSNTGVVVFDISGSALASDLVNHDISFTRQGRDVLHHQRHRQLHRPEQHAFQRRSAGCAVQFRGRDDGQPRAVGRIDPGA